MKILKFVKNPLVRLSFGLVMLTVSLLLVTDFLGLVPDTKSAELKSRKVITESIAVQLSTEISAQRFDGIEDILRSVVTRDEQLLSAAVRIGDKKLLSAIGEHDQNWMLAPGEKSTPTHIRVPLFDSRGRWGSVELVFAPVSGSGGLGSLQGSFFALVLFIGLVGFFAYLLFLKRAMHELNPESVIPERVGQALNTLAEGLLIVDKTGRIVFSNSAFADKLSQPADELLGKAIDGFDWQNNTGQEDMQAAYPWNDVLEGKVLSGSVVMRLKSGLDDTYIFSVNTSPITADKGQVRGVLITFDDNTEIEAKNEQLRRTLLSLEKSKHEITRQNEELQVLADRDPLTGALNRRSLFQGMDVLFSDASESGEELSCIMVDIDHFKSVNDRFGHAVGDEVIKLLTHILTECSRARDLVARMGGEEFIVVLPETNIEVAANVAERVRVAVENGQTGKFANGLKVTSSFGVATLSFGAASALELIDQADKALYAAKENGRNQVVCWPDMAQADGGRSAFKLPQKKHGADLSEPVPAANVIEGKFGVEVNESDHADEQQPSSAVEESGVQQLEQALTQIHNLTPSEIAEPSSRIVLFDRIQQAIKRTTRDNSQIAVLIMDIGGLQRINDTLGVAVGEKLAKQIILRLKQVLRLTDTVTVSEELLTILRLERNEIAVLLTDLQHAEIIMTILKRIFSEFKEPVDVESTEVYLNTSVGVSVFPCDGEDPETLLRNASSAMHEAKESQGNNNFRFYSEDINQQAKKQIQMEAELYRAIERDELMLYYQPKIDLRTGEICGMEALVRWNHPRLGMVFPNDFISTAEQSGLIDELSRWIFRVVCRQIIFWQKAGYQNITVAVNLSTVEFRNPKLADDILALLDEFGVATSALHLEVTETAVMQSLDAATAILEQLNDAGVSISIDDFGTGYSSLNYLKKFPLKTVKIDRSYTADLMTDGNDASIVSAIIAMSHSLGLRVVAEGVETEEQLRFLQDLQCDEMQGYLVSRPLTNKQMSELLAEPGAIRRLILKRRGHMELVENDDDFAVSGMLGVLSDFSSKDLQ